MLKNAALQESSLPGHHFMHIPLCIATAKREEGYQSPPWACFEESSAWFLFTVSLLISIVSVCTVVTCLR